MAFTADTGIVAPRMMDFWRSLRLWRLKNECAHLERIVEVAALGWINRKHRLDSLKECERTRFFAEQELELNELWLKDIKNKLLRKCVKKVIRVQRALVMCQQEAEAAAEQEKALDAQWWDETRQHREGN